jgi:hypothetical protein
MTTDMLCDTDLEAAVLLAVHQVVAEVSPTLLKTVVVVVVVEELVSDAAYVGLVMLHELDSEAMDELGGRILEELMGMNKMNQMKAMKASRMAVDFLRDSVSDAALLPMVMLHELDSKAMDELGGRTLEQLVGMNKMNQMKAMEVNRMAMDEFGGQTLEEVVPAMVMSLKAMDSSHFRCFPDSDDYLKVQVMDALVTL